MRGREPGATTGCSRAGRARRPGSLPLRAARSASASRTRTPGSRAVERRAALRRPRRSAAARRRRRRSPRGARARPRSMMLVSVSANAEVFMRISSRTPIGNAPTVAFRTIGRACGHPGVLAGPRAEDPGRGEGPRSWRRPRTTPLRRSSSRRRRKEQAGGSLVRAQYRPSPKGPGNQGFFRTNLVRRLRRVARCQRNVSRFLLECTALRTMNRTG